MKYAITATHNPCGTALNQYSIRFGAWYSKNDLPLGFGVMDINFAYRYREQQHSHHKRCTCSFEVVEI